MRHFVLTFSITALSLGMSAGPAERALIASAGTTHTLTACQPRTLPGTVDIAVVALGADLHLHPASATLVEPVGRLLKQPHAPPPKALDSAREARHKGPAKPPPKGAEHEGPGSDANQTNPGLRLFWLCRPEHNGTAYARHRPHLGG